MNAAFRALRSAVYRSLIASLRLLFRSRHRRHFKLAVLKLDRLGDAVLSLGAVRRLIAQHGEKDTLLIVSTIAGPLFRREFPEAALLVLPAFCERFWPDLLMCLIRHAGHLRAISVETLVCLRHQHSDYLHAVAHLLDVTRCHAARWQHGSEHISLSFPRCSYVSYPAEACGACLEIEAHRRVVASATGMEITLREVLPVLAGAPARGGGLLICPAAGDGIREYPAARMQEVIRLFQQQMPDMRISVCLPPGSSGRRWQEALVGCHIGGIEWQHPESIEMLITAIAGADLVLAPDSAPAHLASALDIPGVFLLGGGHFGMFAPWSRSGRQQWLAHEMGCYQCQWACRHPEAYCLTQIPPQAVAQALCAAAGAGISQSHSR